MGVWYEYKCGSCGYRAEVSGGDDAGMVANTTTILCEECQELYDVVTFRRDGMTESDEASLGAVEPACPKSGRHASRRWKYPDACPKCGTEMSLGESIAIWD